MKNQTLYALILLILALGISKSAYAQDFNEIILNKEFEIINDWAYPTGAGRVNIITNMNHIRFQKDSIDIFLPYFGVRHAGVYGNNGGIEFQGKPEEISIIDSEENKPIRIEFDIKHQMEDLNFLIEIYASGRTDTSVNSSQRSSISYHGSWQKVKKE